MNNTTQFFLNKKDKKLFESIESNKIKKFKRLLKKGANIHCINLSNYTPLLYAIAQNNINIIRLLLLNGANVHDKTSYKMSSILLASSCSNLDVAMLLLQYGANINDVSEFGYTPIHIACITNKVDIVEYYLKNGAQIYIKPDDTPILLCASYGRKSIIELLLSNGCNINDQNSFGENVIEILQKQKHFDCLETIKRWSSTMFINIFIELNIYNGLDLSLIADIYEYSYSNCN
jgi:ankyrin repeat protein